MSAGHNYTEAMPDWRALGFHRDITMAQAFAHHARTTPDRQIVFWSKERVDETTIGEVHAQALKIAAALQALGVRKGDVVGLQIASNLQGALAFQAVMLLGAAVLPIVHNYGPAETSYVLRQSRACAYVIPDRLGKVFGLEQIAALEPLPDLKHIIVIGDEAPDGGIRWKDLVAGAPDDPIREVARPDDVALVLYTSGTTSAPKGVQYSHNSMLAEVNITMIPDDGSGRSTLSAWPLGHAAGIFAFLKGHLGGIPTVMMDRWDVKAAAQLIQDRKVAASGGAPVMLSDLLELADTGAFDISSLKDYQCGAAAVSPALMEHAERYGILPYRSYGSSEHPSITRGSPRDPEDKRLGTDGRPSPGNEVRIVNEQDEDLPVGAEGDIVSRGPEMFLGYRDSSLNAAAMMPSGGWYRTGDIGRLDDQGYLTITDRKKDIIIRGGENISSKEVEDMLVRHPAILEAAVVAAPHPRLGEIVCAFILPRPGAGEVTLEGVQTHFAELGVAKFKTPERLELVSEFPRTAAGKIRKFELRDSLR